MLYLWTCILWMIGVAQAGEVTLRYSTNLESSPSVVIEQNGTQVYPTPKRSGMQGAFYVWSIEWDSDETWVQQVHIDHDSTSSVSTVVMGRVDDQELFLLNDTVSKTQQWISTTGGIEQTRGQERSHRLHSLIWLVFSGLLCAGISWFTPSVSGQSLRRGVFKRFAQAPYWLTALFSFGFFIACSLWLQRMAIGFEGIPAVYHDAFGSYWMIGRSSTWKDFFDASTQFPPNRLPVVGFLHPMALCTGAWQDGAHELYRLWVVLDLRHRHWSRFACA